MAIDKVRDYFGQFGMEGRIREFEVSSATVELAAQALSCEPARIAKTLSFLVGGPYSGGRGCEDRQRKI